MVCRMGRAWRKLVPVQSRHGPHRALSPPPLPANRVPAPVMHPPVLHPPLRPPKHTHTLTLSHPPPTRSYETMLVLRPTMKDEERDQELARFQAFLQKQGATGLSDLVRGRQRLAYPIKRWVPRPQARRPRPRPPPRSPRSGRLPAPCLRPACA